MALVYATATEWMEELIDRYPLTMGLLSGAVIGWWLFC